MAQEDKDFECYLIDKNFTDLVDNEDTLIKIGKQLDGGFCNYLKNQILNDRAKLEQLLITINNQWKKDQKVELKREQIFTLIILMFLKLINRKKQFGGFYIINMEYIKRAQIYICNEKMQCIMNYIMLFYQNKDIILFDGEEKVQFKNEVVTFIKNNQINAFQFQVDEKSKQNISMNITYNRNEDQNNSTVVDFADENIGGLTLDSSNCAQEEILMLIFPEALVSMIFIPPLKASEAILIKNIKKFSNYSGYEQSFRWKKQNDLNQQRYNMLAIDAKPFSGNQLQFKQQNLEREMLKCYSGFSLALKFSPNNDISTGRWGCGIFGGNQYLKTIIQLTCFAQAKYETDNNTAKLIINASSNEDLYKFGNELKKFETVLNLQNLTNLIKELQKFQFQNDYQFQNMILQYFQSKMKDNIGQIIQKDTQ